MSKYRLTYNDPILYSRFLKHSKCILDLESLMGNRMQSSAIEITNYDNGENLAIECVKCNAVIMDIDRPYYGGE